MYKDNYGLMNSDKIKKYLQRVTKRTVTDPNIEDILEKYGDDSQIGLKIGGFRSYCSDRGKNEWKKLLKAHHIREDL